MTAAAISRGARGFVLAGAAFLVAATLAAVVDLPQDTVVALGLHGFVFHTVYGEAYSLVPSYFDRSLAAPRAPTLQLPLSVLGALGMAVPVHGARLAGPTLVPVAGAVLWAGGAAVFLATVGWTIRDNLAGAETGTGDSKGHLVPTDRAANAVVPLALVSLAAGAYDAAAVAVGGPALTGSTAAASHLLAVGTAALLVFGLGARLFPRLLRATPPTPLVALVLVAGGLGPWLLVGWLAGGVAGLPRTPLLHAAVGTLGLAVVAHATLVAVLLARAPSPRLGAYGVLAGAVGGVATVAAGAAVGLGVAPALVLVHPRLGLLGFLGLTVLGVVYHFYPPAIAGEYGDRVAGASVVLVGGGLVLEVGGVVLDAAVAELAGRSATAAGALLYAGLLGAIVRARG